MTDTSAVATSIEELLALRRDAHSALRSSRLRVRHQQQGQSAAVALGRGLDFAESRTYQAGDDVRNMDWNVTARSGIAHTKLFVEERERPTYLLVDLAPSMWFATRGMFKAMLAVRIAALLGWCAVAGNDRVGGIVVDGLSHREVKPQAGRRGMMALIRHLAAARNNESASVKTDPELVAGGSVEDSLGSSSGRQPGSRSSVDPAAQRASSTRGSDLAQDFLNNLGRLQQMTRSGGDVIVISDFLAFDQTIQTREAATDTAATRLKEQSVASEFSSPLAGSPDSSRRGSELVTRLASIATRTSLTLVQIYDPLEQELPEAGKLQVLMQGMRGQLAQSRQDRLNYSQLFKARQQGLEQVQKASARARLHQFSTVDEPLVALQSLLRGGA